MVEADMFFMREGSYDYDPSVVRKAHEWCQGMVRNAMDIGIDICVTGTLVRRWEVQIYLDMAKAYNYTTKIYFMTGDYSNIHNVPQDTIKRMSENFELIPEQYMVLN